MWCDAYEAQLMVSCTAFSETNTVTYWKLSTHLYTESVSWKVDRMLWCFTVEAEWSPVGVIGGSVDEDVLNAVFKWLWEWWWSQSIQARQVRELRATFIQCVVLSVLELVEDTQWLAGVTDWSLGPSSTKEIDSTWVYTANQNRLSQSQLDVLDHEC